jgi:hypothetical protein
MDHELRAGGRSGFHDALFLLILDAMSLVALWLLWRPTTSMGGADLNN